MDVDSAVVKEGLAQLTIVVEVVASHDPVVVDRVDPEGGTFTWELESIFRCRLSEIEIDNVPSSHVHCVGEAAVRKSNDGHVARRSKRQHPDLVHVLVPKVDDHRCTDGDGEHFLSSGHR